MGKVDEGAQNDMNKFWVYNAQYGDYSQVYLKVVKIVHLKRSHHQKKIFIIVVWVLTRVIMTFAIVHIVTFAVCTYIESCFTPETNSMLYVQLYLNFLKRV